jgi:acyl-CoA thioester hydrolase
MESDGVALPVVEAHCEYHRPARYDDELDVRTSGRLVSPVRLVFDYDITRDEDRIVSGRTVHASLNPQGRPVRLPERVRNYFA